jgi:hypothetical protein
MSFQLGIWWDLMVCFITPPNFIVSRYSQFFSNSLTLTRWSDINLTPATPMALPRVPGRNQTFCIFRNLRTQRTPSLGLLRGGGCTLAVHSTAVKAHSPTVAERLGDRKVADSLDRALGECCI